MEEMGVLKTIEGYKNVWQLANDRLFDKAKNVAKGLWFD